MRILKAAGTVIGWVLQVLVAVLFVIVGTGKFGDPSWAGKFAAWGYPDGFYMVVGVLEALGGVLLLWPRLTAYAAAFLGIIMIGAALTLLVHGETGRAGVPLVYLVLLSIVGVLRRQSAFRAVRSGTPQLEQV